MSPSGDVAPGAHGHAPKIWFLVREVWEDATAVLEISLTFPVNANRTKRPRRNAHVTGPAAPDRVG